MTLRDFLGDTHRGTLRDTGGLSGTMTRANGPGAAVCAGLDARHSETNTTVTSKSSERYSSTSQRSWGRRKEQ